MVKISENEKNILSVFMVYEEISSEVSRLLASENISYGYSVIKTMKDKSLITKSSRKVDIRKNNKTKRKSSKNNKTKNRTQSLECDNVMEPERPNYYRYSAYHINPKVKRTLFLRDESKERLANTGSLESELKRSDTVLMCWLAGIVGYEKYSDTDPTYYQIDNMEIGYININPFAKDSSAFDLDLFRQLMNEYGVVIPFKDIREKLGITAEDKQHFNFSSATGFLSGKHNPYLLYHANHGYVSSSAKGEQRMAEKVFQYMAMQGVYKLTGMRIKVGRGIIFVRNKNDFKRLVFNTYQCDRARFSNFEYMYIIPETSKGLEFLSFINNYPDITHSVIQIMISTGHFKYNQFHHTARYFLLMDKSERIVYFGADMNYNTMAEVYYEYMHTGIDFSIMCFDWQEEYYRSVFGDDRDYIIIKTDVIMKRMSNI